MTGRVPLVISRTTLTFYMGRLTANLSRRISRPFGSTLTRNVQARRYLQTVHDYPQETSSELALLLSKYSQKPPRPLTLNKLLSFGLPLTRDSLLESASYALSELPRRLVGRVQALEALPFIVTTNPFLSRTLRLYKKSFEELATHPSVKTLEQNWKFMEQLEGLVTDHTNDIPTMAKGLVLRRHHPACLTIRIVSKNALATCRPAISLLSWTKLSKPALEFD